MRTEMEFINLEKLTIPQKVSNDLKRFLDQIADFYKKDLVSITAFGSCVTGDYSEKISDINLLVIYSDLNIADLERVAQLSRKWLSKRRFSPRFLSKRNLIQSAKYFQVDYTEMKDAHLVLFGEDVLASLPSSRIDLHWQISYEIKAMRMRIKQQFWRAGANNALLRRILIERFGSIVHLSRCILILLNEKPAISRGSIMTLSIEKIGIDPGYFEKMAALKKSDKRIDKKNLIELFGATMNAIKIIDDKLEKIK